MKSNTFVKLQGIYFTKTTNFDKHGTQLVSNLLYDSSDPLNDKLLKFDNLQNVTLHCWTDPIDADSFPPSVRSIKLDCIYNHPLR